MNNYRVSFYKDLCNSDGHSFKCLQRQIEVQSTDHPRRWCWRSGWSITNA